MDFETALGCLFAAPGESGRGGRRLTLRFEADRAEARVVARSTGASEDSLDPPGSTTDRHQALARAWRRHLDLDAHPAVVVHTLLLDALEGPARALLLQPDWMALLRAIDEVRGLGLAAGTRRRRPLYCRFVLGADFELLRPRPGNGRLRHILWQVLLPWRDELGLRPHDRLDFTLDLAELSAHARLSLGRRLRYAAPAAPAAGRCQPAEERPCSTT